MNDWELIDAYAQRNSEEAFAQLVRRYVDLVYSSAFRSVNGDAALAQEAAQRTFLLLAKKCAGLSRKTAIVGWLYRTAANVGREVLRAENRRHFYERKAALMVGETDEADRWEEIAPELEFAMEALSESDRVVLLARFFQRKSMREVGEAIGASEDATKMRVSRAVGRLREELARRGVKATAAGLAVVVGARAVEAAPEIVTQGILRAIPAAGGVTIGAAILKAISMGIMKKAAVGGALLALIVGGFVASRNRNTEIGGRVASTVTEGKREAATAVTASTIGDGAADEKLAAAVANLRRVVNEPWGSRRLPAAKLEAALAQFGTNRAAALPVFMEVLNTPQQDRKFEAFILAAKGIELLGPTAMAAWPELRALLTRGDFVVLNDGMPKLFMAISPDGATVPDLIETMKDADYGSGAIGLMIAQMVNANPTFAAKMEAGFSEMLRDERITTRREAAAALARLQGVKNLDAVPVLVDALNLESLRDPHAYDPIVIKEANTTVMREWKKSEDESARLSAIQALREFGPDARAAADGLREVVELTPSTNMVHTLALMALKSVAPDLELPQADAESARRLRAAELEERARFGTATYDELVEALREPESAGAAADRLKELGPKAHEALPAMNEALDNLEHFSTGFEVAQAIKELAPEILVERIATNNLRSLYEVVGALGELGPRMSNALPHLERIFGQLSEDKQSDVIAVAGAIQKIQPNSPQLIFHFDDLHDATSALLKAIYDSEKIRSPVYTEYIREMQDINQVPRPRLIKFVNTIKSEPELHRVFVDALLKKNPSLAAELGPEIVRN